MFQEQNIGGPLPKIELIVLLGILTGDLWFFWASEAETLISQCSALEGIFPMWKYLKWMLTRVGNLSPWPWQLELVCKIGEIDSSITVQVAFILNYCWTVRCGIRKVHQRHKGTRAASRVIWVCREWGTLQVGEAKEPWTPWLLPLVYFKG